ncbi:hypothetical protein RSO01_37900 [Reyranella soli]|uniref:DUF4239 domain-containing protein n=1 Tax=Reyranella soli TaxID=1230389 RepID=A0A512NCI0_9HYPH|nr:hypothetical protein RSO01_37900 [Reyranella soli]
MAVLSVGLFVLAFLCPLLGAAIGSAVRRRLPQHHLDRDVIDVIKLAMGLMATVVALTLGLLISSAPSHHAMIEGEYKKIMASIVDLDQYLLAYGPETQPLRTHERHVAAHTFKRRWLDEDFGPTGPPSEDGPNRFIDGQRQLAQLQPANEAQRWFQHQALQISVELANLHWLVVSQQTATAPLVPIFILIFFSAIAIFAGFSLYAPPNATLLAILVLPALAIAGATFLVVELNNPFSGLLKISSQGAHGLMQTFARSF